MLSSISRISARRTFISTAKALFDKEAKSESQAFASFAQYRLKAKHQDPLTISAKRLAKPQPTLDESQAGMSPKFRQMARAVAYRGPDVVIEKI